MKSRALFFFVALLWLGCGGGSGDADTVAPADAVDAADAGDTADVADAADVPARPHGCVADDFCAADATHAPDPAQYGPFPVGVTTFTMQTVSRENKPRTLTVEVWYPAVEDARDGPFEDMDLIAKAPPEVKEILAGKSVPVIPTNQVRDAKIRATDGPYPLILFSHGAFGVRFQNTDFCTHLASHGYIMASPDHTGNTTYDLFLQGGYNLDSVILSALERPGDVKHVIDRMLERNGSLGDFFHGTIDPEQIGVTGHSFGGYTAFVAGLSDPRVKAIIPMSPATIQLSIMGYDITTLAVPVLIMAGAMDKTLNSEVEMKGAYEKAPKPKYYFELKAGGHFTYTDICKLDLVALATDLGIEDAENALEDGCADYNIPLPQAQALINQFGIGYLNYYLRGSTGSHAFFDAAAAAEHEDELTYLLEE